MPIIDSQVHAHERNHPARPWVGFLHGPEEATGDQMVAAMDQVGVDAFRLSDRLSDGDRSTLMGGALQQVYNWAPTKT